MMKKKTSTPILSRALCLALALTALLLCACPGEIPSGGGSSSSSSTTASTTGGGGGGNPPAPPSIYGDGGNIAEAGDRMAAANPSLIAPVPDEANAPAWDNRLLLMNLPGGAMKAGTYRITDTSPFVLSDGEEETLDCTGIILLMQGGFVLRNCRNYTVRGLTVIGGGITLENCENVTLENVKVINPSGIALTVDGDSSGVTVNACRLDGRVAMANSSSGLSLRASYVAFAAGGLADDGARGTVVRDCRFVGTGIALSTSADGANIMYNTFDLDADSCGIEIKGGELDRTQNAIAALNVIRGAQTGVRAEWTYNSVVLLNSAVSVEAHSNKNFYIVENALGGRIVAKNNDYIIADCNTYPDDGKDHVTLSVANQNANGDALTDLTARLDAGANPDLLPHINKDQFVGMNRNIKVTDHDTGKMSELQDYIMEGAKGGGLVIVAPGAYEINSGRHGCGVFFDAPTSGARVYAYGVLAEYQVGLPQFAFFASSENVTVKGISLGYQNESCGQAYIVGKYEEDGKYYFKIRTAAGFENDFAAGGGIYGTSDFWAHRVQDFYAFRDSYGGALSLSAPDGDGVRTLRVIASLYETMEVGDVLTTRQTQGAAPNVRFYGASGITLYDVTLYGGSTGFAFKEEQNREATTYYRVTITTRTRNTITETEYEEFKRLETKYGISFQMQIDGDGRFRGSPAHIGSLDATHSINCKEGAKISFCVFENMGDDGTNQGHQHARLHAVQDNGDGTTTLTFKGNCSDKAYRDGSRIAASFPHAFSEGDRVFIYNAEGVLYCDTPALAAQTEGPKIYDTAYDLTGYNANYITSYCVKVATSALNPAALTGYDLATNNPVWNTKICVDNMSYACNNIFFDNCVMQNVRSRGLLIKGSSATVKHCTFRNLGMAGVGIIQEKLWGESGPTQNVVVEHNLFDNVGFFPMTAFASTEHEQVFSPIVVCGYGVDGSHRNQLYRNIRISHNVIRNRQTSEYAILVKGAQDVIIEGNDLGSVYTGTRLDQTIWLEACNGVIIRDNIYPNPAHVVPGITAISVKDVTGSDVEDAQGNRLIPDNA